MTDQLTPEELALLEADEKPARKRKVVEPKPREDAAVPAPAPVRGPYTPVQYDDDGWGDRPIQMRG